MTPPLITATPPAPTPVPGVAVDYRIYAHGLIAGGWAGTYFTTYAMRAVDAARVLDSDLVAIVCLVAVAAGMVWHSLRYRSQEGAVCWGVFRGG